MGYQPDEKDEGRDWLASPDFAIIAIVSTGDQHLYQIKLGQHFYPLQFDNKSESWYIEAEGVKYFVSISPEMTIEKVLSVLGSEILSERRTNWTIVRTMGSNGSGKFYMNYEGEVFEITQDPNSELLVCNMNNHNVRYYFKPTSLELGKKLEYESWELIGSEEHPKLPFF